VRISVDLAPLRQSHVSGHLVRFVIGGAVTVCTGLIAKAAGPKVGGLFLALPAIFPVGLATIVKLHKKGVPNGRGDRARHAAIIEATGASIGSLGLLVFGLVAWIALDRWPTWLALLLAMGAWTGTAVVCWRRRKAPRARRSPNGA